ncbi:hypothetical protein [Aquimarina brevivitae]|uniref:Uncharacterized protein n=1 Tax=Aquimarina brevivitae TaxID=323412 RepID=A0A4Q7NX53_9FLAO|nr:hypothetical protein [Aquimarina brevivitae]RZS91941.1 hypothetical protein EV197_3045 [Aquimarina brevivitae]
MSKPIKLRLVEVKNEKYFLKYPNLSVPIAMNEQLFTKFLNSDEYFIEGVPHHKLFKTKQKRTTVNV